MNNQEMNRESLIIHIEGLQVTLAKRNARIAELENLIAQSNKQIQKEQAIRKAYKQGWKDCASQLAETTRDLALKLREVRKDAWKIYTEGEQK